MPPKEEKKPEKKKPEGPKEMCMCGVNTFRAPPKGKKYPAPVVHAPGCTFQRASCNRYPHLPKCSVCEKGACPFCLGAYPWCVECNKMDEKGVTINKCKYVFKRDVLDWVPKDPNAAAAAAGGGDAAAQGAASGMQSPVQ